MVKLKVLPNTKHCILYAVEKTVKKAWFRRRSSVKKANARDVKPIVKI